MTITPFGPQLIGQTEKALNALLGQVLGDRLTEPEWVTLRLALQLEGRVAGGAELAAEVATRSRLSGAGEIVARLTAAGLLADGRATDDGRSMVEDLQGQIAVLTRPIWDGLPADDVAAAARVLTEVLERTRALLAPTAA